MFINLLTFQSPIYRLQSNSYLITFKDADPLGRDLKCYTFALLNRLLYKPEIAKGDF
jgi:hypothetical protein